MCWEYSLEAPQRGASIEYPQHMFLWRSKKKNQYFRLEKCLIWGYAIESNLVSISVLPQYWLCLNALDSEITLWLSKNKTSDQA